MFFYTFNAVKVRKNIFIFAVILTNFIITMAMSKVEYHPNYDRYVEMITAHPNYNGLYYERKQDGRVKWVVASKSKNWLKRLAWWDDVCRRLGITIQKAATPRRQGPSTLRASMCANVAVRKRAYSTNIPHNLR